MKKIDPFKDRINAVAFNGAANVQKASDLLQDRIDFDALTGL